MRETASQVKRDPARFETRTSVIPAVISLTSLTSSLGSLRLKSNPAGGVRRHSAGHMIEVRLDETYGANARAPFGDEWHANCLI